MTHAIRRRFSIAALVLGWSAAAAAQTPPHDVAPAAVAPPPAASNDPWALYDQAFAEQVAHHDAQALGLFVQVVREFPNSPAAAHAREMIRLLRSAESGAVTPRPKPRPAPSELSDEEAPSKLSRAEFVTFQTLTGIAVASELLIMANSNSAPADAAVGLAGAGLGFGLSFGLSDGITPGRALAIEAGTLWGAINGGLIAGTLSSPSGTAVVDAILAGQLTGLALGAILSGVLPTRAGDVSLADSGGLWLGIETGLIVAALSASNETLNGQAISFAILAASDVGIIAGAILAQHFPMSRSRAILIDLGGLLGALVGFGIPLIAQANGTAAYAIPGAIGIPLGLALSAFLTRNWDVPDLPPARLSVASLPDNGHALLVSWNW